MRVEGGRTHYGQSIGVLTLDTCFPRILGDVANAKTYPFPVKFRTVSKATIERVVKQGGEGLLAPFLEEARRLESEGVSAITTSCGFLSVFQDELAKQLRVPVFSSTLMVIPLIHRMLGPGQKVGIITADSGSLTERHLKGAGAGSVPVAIAGLEGTKEFASTILADRPTLDPEAVEKEIVAAAKRLVRENPDVGAMVFECANLAPYAEAVHRAVGLPVFDIVSLINFVHATVEMNGRFRDKNL
jgi:Asp/Glu/hydantoin racemase